MPHESQHSFDVVLRGYDKHQVAETIERLEADFRIALEDRDAAAGRASDMASQLAAMHAEIEQLRRKAATASAPTFENISERIQHMLQLAEEEAGEIRRAAEADAQAQREQTAAEERAMLERHAAGQAEVERMLAEARQNAEQIAQAAQIRADELVAKAQERVARLDAESQARRAKVEEDFDIAQRARRAEAQHQEEERERVSTQAARQRIATAEQQAGELVAEAEAKAAAIRNVRDELTSRLHQARQLLSTLPDLNDRPEPAEQPRTARGSGDSGEGQHPAVRPEAAAPPTQPAVQQAPARAHGEPATTEARVATPPRPTPVPNAPSGESAPAGGSTGPGSTSANQVQGPPTKVQPAVRPESNPPTRVQPAVQQNPPTQVQPAVGKPSPTSQNAEQPVGPARS
jgi:cell division septum initiation protein DivIVA